MKTEDPTTTEARDPWEVKRKAVNKLGAFAKVRQLTDSSWPDDDEVKVPIRFGDIRAIDRALNITYSERVEYEEKILAAEMEAVRAKRERDEARSLALEDAVAACEQQQRDFLDPAYATPQPAGSISERFAIAECIKAIRALGKDES